MLQWHLVVTVTHASGHQWSLDTWQPKYLRDQLPWKATSLELGPTHLHLERLRTALRQAWGQA